MVDDSLDALAKHGLLPVRLGGTALQHCRRDRLHLLLLQSQGDLHAVVLFFFVLETDEPPFTPVKAKKNSQVPVAKE